MPFTLLSSNAISGGVGDSLRPNAKPLIINGNMAVAQRGTSATGKTTAGYYACDRWSFAIANAGTWTVSQVSDSPSGQGFSNSAEYDNTTAQGSLDAAAYIIHRQSIEGQNLQLLKKGTSNAEKLTVSFWVRATKTGTNIVELYDNTNNRQCSKAYTISSSNTWEYKVVNFPADTSGTLANNNSGALNVQFYLAAGSNLSSGTLQETWAGYVNANRAVGQVNHADSTSNNFWITGVQLEIGEYTSSTLPPFQHESYADNLKRCLRYFYCPNMNGESYTSIGQGNGYNSSRVDVPVFFPVAMRTAPSVSLSGGTAIRFEGNAEDINASAISIGNVATTTGDVFNNSLSGVNQGYAYRLYLNDSGTTKMFFNSEL